MGFKEMEPGEKLKSSERPYFKKYINRTAIRYESNKTNKTFYTEQDLAELFEQGNNILLIGNPTEGKTRTLFEVIKKLNNFIVISLPTDRSPSDMALQFLEGKKVIWFLDENLNVYQNITLDFKYTFNRLKEITTLCVIAATCRAGPELIDGFLKNTGQLNGIYNLFDLKLELEPAEAKQIKDLEKALNEAEIRIFPTLGSICMRRHFEFMRDRFGDLPTLEQDCLRSIFLLFSGFIYPFTLQRIKGVLLDIFKYERNNIDDPKIRGSLNNLVANGFIITPKDVDPIFPEAAYITKPESEFYYPKNRSFQNDKAALVNCLKKQKDIDGLNNLAKSYLFFDNKDSALSIWEQISIEFTNTDDVISPELVAEAFFNKGVTLSQLDKFVEAVQCYEEVIQRYGNNKQLVLQKLVAKSFVNKGVTLGQQGKFDEAIKCYNEAIQRFSNSKELVLQEQVAKALGCVGEAFGHQGKSDEEIRYYSNLVQRFSNSKELVLQKRVATVLVKKGFTLGHQGKFDEAVQCYEEAIQRFSNSKELVLQEQVTKVLCNKGLALGKLNKTH